jgi:hypothetical protein
MRILEKFQAEPFFKRLNQRQDGFSKIIAHLEKQMHQAEILETGTLRITDNFEGDGQSTFIWNWFARQFEEEMAYFPTIRSVDIDIEAVKKSVETNPLVKVYHMDSVKYLNQLHKNDLCNLGLLYLDSFDWHPDINLDSAFHHIAELTAVWSKLPSDCMIVVDDRHSDIAGKHLMVEYFMEKLGIEPAFKGYQIGWIKP